MLMGDSMAPATAEPPVDTPPPAVPDAPEPPVDTAPPVVPDSLVPPVATPPPVDGAMEPPVDTAPPVAPAPTNEEEVLMGGYGESETTGYGYGSF